MKGLGKQLHPSADVPLSALQNPKDCHRAKLVLCDLQKGCGFGCQLHHVTYCLVVAYAMQRTLVLQSKGWRYATKGWDSVFMPLSKTCKEVSGPTMHWGGECVGGWVGDWGTGECYACPGGVRSNGALGRRVCGWMGGGLGDW